MSYFLKYKPSAIHSTEPCRCYVVTIVQKLNPPRTAAGFSFAKGQGHTPLTETAVSWAAYRAGSAQGTWWRLAPHSFSSWDCDSQRLSILIFSGACRRTLKWAEKSLGGGDILRDFIKKVDYCKWSKKESKKWQAPWWMWRWCKGGLGGWNTHGGCSLRVKGRQGVQGQVHTHRWKKQTSETSIER